jgi:hypothetical protein
MDGRRQHYTWSVTWYDIATHGARCTFMAEVPEYNHVLFAKRLGRASQKNNKTLKRQVATRISDSMMIVHVHKLY